MINLFEYQNKESFPPERFDDLELFLDEIWSKREKNVYFRSAEESREEEQRFVQFLHRDSLIKSNKYVGVIHFEGHTINLLPKIFFNGSKELSKVELGNINRNILWWLSYCTKIKFPNYLSGLNSETADFFEILIYLFSKYTKELLCSSMYQRYVEVERDLRNVKGRIDFNAYINENLAIGRHHQVSCIYDSFELDNQFNQCVKYVSKLLAKTSKNPESLRNLNEILFLLDDVSDAAISANICKNISFNTMFSDFETIRDYCMLFLENSISFNFKDELKLFTFLLPMEYVFEDFIYGFIRREIPGVSVRRQATSVRLDVDKRFGLQPDLVVEVGESMYIADTKYKIVYDDRDDISEGDLYQMVTYGIRYRVEEIKLLYPGTIHQLESEAKTPIRVKDEFSGDVIRIEPHKLSIIAEIDGEKSNESLEKVFRPIRESLSNYLKNNVFEQKP